MTKLKQNIDNFLPLCEKSLKQILDSLQSKKNVFGTNKVRKSIESEKDLEQKLDLIVPLQIGDYFSNISKVERVEFEKKLINKNPHDIVLTFCGAKIVVEVKRIRETERCNETSKDMIKSNYWKELIDNGEMKKLTKLIIDDKYRQLENSYPNIIFIVSKDLYFRADNTQDSAKEIIRFDSKFYYPNFEGSQYNMLNALLHMDENTCEINGYSVFNNYIVEKLISLLNQ